MNLKGRRVLVTGAGGFIGSHLVERLVALGAETRAFVHYNAMGTVGWLEQSPIRSEIEIVAGDLTDRDSVRKAVEGRDVIFHLGALIAIPYSYHAPASYTAVNVVGTLNVLQACLSERVERLVHTSTSEVYGTARQVPITEEHPLQAQSPYAATKIGADKLVEAFHRSYGLPAVTIRPFNTFGPRQSLRAVIPTIASQALAGPVIRLGNLDPTRDLNYVEDTVKGFVAAASAEAVGRTVNLGSGREISIGELANLIASLVDHPCHVEVDEARVRPSGSEVERLVADSRLATSLLGWEPRIELEDGLRLTIEWLRRQVRHGDVERYVQ